MTNYRNYDQDEEDPTEKYEENYTGVRANEPDRNQRIRQMLNVQNSAEKPQRSLDASVIKRAWEIVSAPFPQLGDGEQIGLDEFRMRLRKIKDIGHEVPPYLHLNLERTRSLYGNLRIQISREICFD